MLGAHARVSRLLLNQLHRITLTKPEYGRVGPGYVHGIQPPRLVPNIRGALERLCRGQIVESNTRACTQRTHPHNRVCDDDAVGIARKHHALGRARLEGKCPERVPPPASDLLIDLHVRSGSPHSRQH